MHHGENLYGCQYCDYIDFNRSEMKIHMRKNHLLEVTNAQQSNIIVIRQTMLEDNINDKNISKGVFLLYCRVFILHCNVVIFICMFLYLVLSSIYWGRMGMQYLFFWY